LGAEGAYVVLSGREQSAMDESAARIVASGGRAEVVVADVRDANAIQGLVDAAVGAVGQLDVFVNNAGVSFLSPILATDVESWRLMLETNVLALLFGCQTAVRAMRVTGNRGHIVNISSLAARDPNSGVYGATKHAVNVISNSLRLELLEDPIQVTTIMPGLVATNIGRNVDVAVLEGLVVMSGLEAEVRAGERLPDEVLERAQTALHDIMIKPDDVAGAVMYALSQPPSVHVAEIVVRPNKDFAL
jgi:NADP-dependent 3-hydroxy acid dehydrogenase YdfG